MPKPITPAEIDTLAQDLYEGTPRTRNLAESLAREFGDAGALTFYPMMDEDVRNFWRGIAAQIINHSSEWGPNDGCACILSPREQSRLSLLPRVI